MINPSPGFITPRKKPSLKKKFFAFSLLFLVLTAPVFSSILTSIASGDFEIMDIPLIDGMDYFMKTIAGFYAIAIILANLLGVICILWNAFRLWFGTEAVKKAVVDIICKFLIYLALLNAYPLLIDGVLSAAVNIGMGVGGGYKKVNEQFFLLYDKATKVISNSRSTIVKILESTTDRRLTTSDVEYIAGITSSTVDSVEDIVKQHGFEIYDNATWRQIRAQENAYQDQDSAYTSWETTLQSYNNDVQQEIMEAFKDNAENEEALLTLKAFQEVLVETTATYEDGTAEGFSRIGQFMYNPFLTSKNGKMSNMLSPAAMIKTSVLISDIIARTSSSELITETDEKGVKTRILRKRLIDRTLDSIIHFFFSLLMTVGLVIASICCVIQYIMTIFEYAIVTSVGVIFIPFCLWDGTKNFAAKLVTLFTSYFIKIMVMIMCLFWVYSAFLTMGIFIMSSPAPLNFLNVSNFIFTCLLGWVVTQNGPQIAVTILNGSPQLSMGEFMHAVGTAAAAGFAAKKAADSAGKIGGAAARGFQGANRGAATVASAWGGAGKAINELSGSIEKSGGQPLSSSQKMSMRASAMANMMGHRVRDSAVQMLTGQELKHDRDSQMPHVGGGKDNTYGTNSGTQTAADAKDNAYRYTQDMFSGKTPKPPEPPAPAKPQQHKKTVSTPPSRSGRHRDHKPRP